MGRSALVNLTTREVLAILADDAAAPTDPNLALVAITADQEVQLQGTGIKTLALDGTITSTPIPPAIVFSGTTGVFGHVTTTSAAPVELFRLTLAAQTGYDLVVRVIAVDSGNGAIKKLVTDATLERINGGPLLIGRTDTLVHATAGAAGNTAGVATWTLGAAFSGNDLVLTAVGAAGRTVAFYLAGSVVLFGPGGLS